MTAQWTTCSIGGAGGGDGGVGVGVGNAGDVYNGTLQLQQTQQTCRRGVVEGKEWWGRWRSGHGDD